MEFCGEGIDEVLVKLYQALRDQGGRNEDGSRGASTELLGVTLRLSNPRARLSRSEDRGKPFSALGELLWYLSGAEDLEFIRPYVKPYEDDAVDGILPGAYGPRLFRMHGDIDQIANVTRVLRKKAGTRRAVIQLFDASDIVERKTEIPCTTTLQFHGRGGKLHMSVCMRSNDAYLGLPHDVFCFTMIQEMLAQRLDMDLGDYIHHASSMHVYDDHLGSMAAYVEEGHQRVEEMPPMPAGETFERINVLIRGEACARRGELVTAEYMTGEPYWDDLIRLGEIFWTTKHRKPVEALIGNFHWPVWQRFAQTRAEAFQVKSK